MVHTPALSHLHYSSCCQESRPRTNVAPPFSKTLVRLPLDPEIYLPSVSPKPTNAGVRINSPDLRPPILNFSSTSKYISRSSILPSPFKSSTDVSKRFPLIASISISQLDPPNSQLSTGGIRVVKISRPCLTTADAFMRSP